MKKPIDLAKLFKACLCSFEVAKKAKQAGMTSANTYFAYFAYDVNGQVGDCGWLEKVAGMEVFPAINTAFAVAMLENTDLNLSKIELYQELTLHGPDGNFVFNYEGEVYKSENLVDVLVEVWIKHKNA